MDSEENNIKNIFVKVKNTKGKTVNIPNTAQNLYLNEQLGGKDKKIKNIEESENSDSDNESDNTDENEDIEETNENEQNEEQNEDSIESDNDENDENDEDEEDDKEDDEYNEEGANEKDTEEVIEEEGDDCIYNYDDMIDDKDFDKPSVEIPKEQRMTDPQLTTYEKIRILGIRSKQIAMGAKVMVKYDNNIGAVELAKYELDNKMTPLIIKRQLPNNTYELWKINELKIDNDNESNILENIKKTFRDNEYIIDK